jgi:hypothetical protein
MSHLRYPLYSATCLLVLFAGCSSLPRSTPEAASPAATKAAASAGVPFGAPTELTATLVDPINIDLKWKDNASNEAGYFVEYSPDADGNFLIVEALPPNTTSFRHPHLLPHTRFVYRVRPYFGDPSNVAQFTTAAEGPPQQAADPAPENEGHSNAQSLHSVATLPSAAPTHLTAELVPPAGVKLVGEDHAADADGYVFEIKPPWEPDFKVSGFLKAGTRSLVSYAFPFATTFSVRVRAFIYGSPSNVAEQTTGADPTLPAGPATRVQ